MNKRDANKIATRMIKARVSAYTGPYGIEPHTDLPAKKITDTVVKKVMAEFYPQVIESSNYPAIEKLFAEEALADMLSPLV